MRLADYLDTLAWSQTDLAREADISTSTVRRVLNESTISRKNAQAICMALTRGFNRHIGPADINELHYRALRRKPQESQDGQKPEEPQQ